jgi:hypothetical protein
MLPKDLVWNAALPDIVQQAGSGQDPELGCRHRHLAADLDAELGHAPVVAERLPILDHVAEDGYRIQPAFDM